LSDSSDSWHGDQEESGDDSASAAPTSALDSDVSADHDATLQDELEPPPSAGAVEGVSPMNIRTKADILALPELATNRIVLTEHHRSSLEAVFRVYAQAASKRHWFIPHHVSRDAVKEQRSSSASSGPPRGSASVASAPLSGGGRSCASAASAPAALGGAPRVTTQRWRVFTGSGLEDDWTEYRTCCGNPLLNSTAGMSKEAASKHSSLHIINMFKARCEFFSRSPSRDHFTSVVRSMLLEQSTNRVPWQGSTICLSCFRAVLGRCRTWMFNTRNCLSDEEKARFPKRTQRGRLRAPRAAFVLPRVVNLLRAWSHETGHSLPNPKGKDLTIKTLFIPVKYYQELADRLSQYEFTQQRLEQLAPVHVHTVKRAKKWLANKEKLVLKLKTTISLMRCATCDYFDNLVTADYVKKHNRTRQHVLEDTYSKGNHIAAAMKQRAFFQAQKDLAMRFPELVWAMTIDGMDQSKTQLPHRARLDKILDTLTRMKVHAEGGFCFGGPQPVIGLLNFPDVRKDSNLCVLTVERFLDLQFEKLLDSWKQMSESQAAAHAAVAAAAAKLDPELHQRLADAQRAAPSVGADGVYPEDGVGMKWPKRLHLTFDNAASECKNQWMFRFLGLLVLHGVFFHITVSTLIVGHTHDIVDQLFSIWARKLNVHNAETYEKMRLIFREKYATRIEGLVKLMHQRQADGASAAAASVAEPSDASAASESPEDALERMQWEAEAQSIISEFDAKTKGAVPNQRPRDSDLRPYIELQSVSIDVQGWIKSALAPVEGRAQPGVKHKPPELKNIDAAHNFAIEKDLTTGHVYLYNKHLCDSTELPNDGTQQVTHRYRGQQTGDYTTRALLWTALDGTYSDPYKIPPVEVPTKALEKTADVFRDRAAMTNLEHTEFLNMLERLDSAQAAQRASCARCAELSAAYSSIGVIHRRKGADEQDQQVARSKSTTKNKAWVDMVAHLQDPAFKIVHDGGQLRAGWWTKWLQRVKEHIAPAYIRRGIELCPHAR
jgi:hypothetical protein